MPDYSMNEIAKLAGHKPYDSESEWQPAIFIEAHPDGGPHVPYGTKCFVKPTVTDEKFVAYYRKLGCNSCKFFLVSKDQSVSFNDDPFLGQGVATVCEHEILTD